MKRLGLIVALTLVPSVAYAEDFNVGPGQTYTAIGDVAWESLQPGDHVHSNRIAVGGD